MLQTITADEMLSIQAICSFRTGIPAEGPLLLKRLKLYHFEQFFACTENYYCLVCRHSRTTKNGGQSHLPKLKKDNEATSR